MKLLIVGANGFLGRRMAFWFKSKGYKVDCASHNHFDDKLRIDLHQCLWNESALLRNNYSHVIWLPAMHRIDECVRKPQVTYNFNVTNSWKLLSSLMLGGVIPLYFSSDLVFSGEGGGYKENDSRHPTTMYGKQKKEIETRLLDSAETSLIVRMSKLYSLDSDDASPLSEVIRANETGSAIYCASDQFFSPTWADEIPSVIENLLMSYMSGVIHVGAKEKYSRYSFAVKIKERMRLSRVEIKSCSIDDFDFLEVRPKDNTLSVDKLERNHNTVFSTIDMVFDKYGF